MPKTNTFHMMSVATFLCIGMLFATIPSTDVQAQEPNALPGTKSLTLEDDIASALVEGVDRFLIKKLKDSIQAREQHWSRDFSSIEAYQKSIESNRSRLKDILGLKDKRVPFTHPKFDLEITEKSPVYMKTEAFEAYKIKWPVVGDVMAEGLMLVPNLLTFRKTEIPVEPEFTAAYKERALFDSFYAAAHVIALPDADQTPEQLAGLAPGIAPESQFARRLAESGCRVIIPDLISRKMTRRQSDYGGWGSELSQREYLYRSAYEMGRHIIGYEVQTVLSLVDWIESHQGSERRKIGTMGYGEGGMIALYAGAIDTRIDSVGVSGYFGPREGIWEQPISRNVFGLLEQFGDAELATLIAPRSLIIEAAPGPVVELPGKGGAPAKLSGPDPGAVYAEVERARQLLSSFPEEIPIGLVLGSGLPFGSEPALESFLNKLQLGLKPGPTKPITPSLPDTAAYEARQKRLIAAWDRHTQQTLARSPYVRKEFMKSVDTSSISSFEDTIESYRTLYRDEIIGHFADPLLPLNPRSRQTYEGENWTGYEVVLDVFEDVIAYGILCLPNDIQEGEKRPVVVCQHGLEGRPKDIIQGDHRGIPRLCLQTCIERFHYFFTSKPLYLSGSIQDLATQSIPTEKNALFDYHTAASADRELVKNITQCRFRAYCLLRIILWGKISHEDPRSRERLLSIDLFR
jgi:hypothetical protein